MEPPIYIGEMAHLILEKDTYCTKIAHLFFRNVAVKSSPPLISGKKY